MAALGLDLVALCDGDLAHVVAEAHDLHVLRHGHADGGLHPVADALVNLFVLPVAGHDLAGLAQAGADEAVLPVAVGGLVEVHEVHVDFVVRDLLVVLGGKVAPGLLQVAQPVDPHLGRGEGMAPGDDAGALAAVVGLPDNVADLFVGLGGHLVDQRIGQNPGKLLRHFLRAGLHGLQNLRPVKEL